MTVTSRTSMKKAERDTTALEGVGGKDERMKRLNAMKSRTQSAAERRESTSTWATWGAGHQVRTCTSSPKKGELADGRARVF